MKDYNTEKRTL